MWDQTGQEQEIEGTVGRKYTRKKCAAIQPRAQIGIEEEDWEELAGLIGKERRKKKGVMQGHKKGTLSRGAEKEIGQLSHHLGGDRENP